MAPSRRKTPPVGAHVPGARDGDEVPDPRGGVFAGGATTTTYGTLNPSRVDDDVVGDGRDGDNRDDAKPAVWLPGGGPRHPLLTNAQVPRWYSQPLIHTGYRPVTGSVAYCVGSVARVHNETVNILSHLLPAAAAAGGLAWWLPAYFQTRFPRASAEDRLVFGVFLLTSAVCFATSATYHTLLCHSEFYFDLWVRIDYLAIIFQILGSFISGIYVSFYCEPTLQRLYWSMIGTLSVLTLVVVLHPRLQSPRWRALRLATFVSTGLSAFAPVMHAMAIFPLAQLDRQSGLRYYFIEGALILTGAFLYGSRFPESWRPGRFDILAASHQLFHIFVVLGAAVHLYGVLGAFEWNYENPRCPSNLQVR